MRIQKLATGAALALLVTASAPLWSDDIPFHVTAHRDEASPAVQRDQQILQGDPKNKEALAEIVDQLDGAGRWKDAMPYLATLHEVDPNDAARTHQLEHNMLPYAVHVRNPPGLKSGRDLSGG